jgi:ATP-dependent Clp protease ATP-binding subunit ClpX
MPAPRPSERPSIRERIAALEVLTPPRVDEKLVALGYRGQEHARRSASVMAYRHVRRLQRIVLGGVGLAQLGPRENYMFIGPTGCGKTHLVELLFRDILPVPTVTVDITQYSETGYIGEDVAMILARLFEAADGDLLWAACGVVCIDEFDKLASSRSNARFAGEGTTKDVSGFGVQRGLLTLLAGNEAQFPADFGYAQLAPKLTMPLAGVTFVACGAFSGLKSTADFMSTEERIGFGRSAEKIDPEAIAVKLDADVLEHTAAFAKYGFLPELIGRFTRIVGFMPLDEATLGAILRDNVIASYAAEFESEGLKLVVDPSVIGLVVKRALKRELGARGLRLALVPSLEDAAYRYFGQGEEREVHVVTQGEAIVIE